MDDLISRQVAIDAINHICPVDTEYDCTLLDRVDVRCVLSDLPSAQPERKTGRWILWNYPGEECAICSACGEEYDQMELYIGGNDYPKYCPNCGARMDDDIPMEYFENGGI